MVRIGIILGSTRPGRNGEAVAKWVYEQAQARDDAEYEYIDLVEQDLPLLDEPIPPAQGQYQKEHTKRWADVISGLDGFVFVTPEYNHGTSAALKNAIDYLFAEWNNKAAGFVGYGSAGGVRAIENLRLVMGELKVADVRSHVALSLFEDFEDFRHFKPRDMHKKSLESVFDEVVSWAMALQGVRNGNGHGTTGSQKVAEGEGKAKTAESRSN